MDQNGDCMVDEIIKYEDLSEGMGRICDRFGIPFEGSLGVRAKGDYRKDRTHYSKVLEKRHIEIIDRVYRKEIEMHGYVFEDLSNTTD